MTPVHLYSDWDIRETDNETEVDPLRRYIFLCEGQNTEVWYFQSLIEHRRALGISALVQIRLCKKTGSDKGSSHPTRLLSLSREAKIDPSFKFNSEYDKIVIVFDTDVFRSKPKKYLEIIKDGEEQGDILGITNPSFELFLLLHYKEAYDNVVHPEKEKILENKKTGQRRYVAARFTEISGINAKENSKVGDLVKNVDVAIEQEKKLNQDVHTCLGCLTSNIGKIIQEIRTVGTSLALFSSSEDVF